MVKRGQLWTLVRDPHGGVVKIHSVVQFGDRAALRDNHGFVSQPTMNSVEDALREFLELP
jgi:mRNA interferase MazF